MALIYRRGHNFQETRMWRTLLLTLAVAWPVGGMFFYSMTKVASRADEAAEHAQSDKADSVRSAI